MMTSFLIRLLDLCFALLGFAFCLPVLLLIAIIGYFDTGSPFFRQVRVGKNKKPFVLIKFRTMAVDTESVATHLAKASSVTRFGAFLRATKLDELPQLINVIRGDMCLVGPRPNLFNQEELIAVRDSLGVYNVLPGVTGLAQIKSIDMSAPELLAKTDLHMIQSMSVKNYLKYIYMTVLGHGAGDRVRD